MCSHVLALRDAGITILIVEHSVPIMRTLCEEVVVLNFGSVIAKGKTSDVLEDPAVIAAYIGD